MNIMFVVFAIDVVTANSFVQMSKGMPDGIVNVHMYKRVYMQFVITFMFFEY